MIAEDFSRLGGLVSFAMRNAKKALAGMYNFAKAPSTRQSVESAVESLSVTYGSCKELTINALTQLSTKIRVNAERVLTLVQSRKNVAEIEVEHTVADSGFVAEELIVNETVAVPEFVAEELNIDEELNVDETVAVPVFLTQDLKVKEPAAVAVAASRIPAGTGFGGTQRNMKANRRR
ncbi:hypothetical protein BH10CYA1_BH10CYA1_53520 [soil metagenome]